MILRKATARAAILDRLSNGEWWYVLDLMRAAHVPSGVLYPALYELEDEELVVSRWEGLGQSANHRHRRRMYHLADGEG